MTRRHSSAHSRAERDSGNPLLPILDLLTWVAAFGLRNRGDFVVPVRSPPANRAPDPAPSMRPRLAPFRATAWLGQRCCRSGGPKLSIPSVRPGWAVHRIGPARSSAAGPAADWQTICASPSVVGNEPSGHWACAARGRGEQENDGDGVAHDSDLSPNRMRRLCIQRCPVQTCPDWPAVFAFRLACAFAGV